MEDIAIDTPDGYRLPATLFESNAGLPGDGPLVLISSATAVSRGFYRHFAQYLADSGARAVMTYDYRGISGEMNRAQSGKARMTDWATIDLPAAVTCLNRRFPGHPLCGLGHSFGGQALGLCGVAGSFTRYMTLAAGSGYLGFTADPSGNRLKMNWLGRPAAALFGYLPSWVGFGEPLPRGIFEQWRRWCNDPHYFMHDDEVPERERFSDVTIPMMAVGFEDDTYATRRSVDAMMGWYHRAGIRLKWFTPEEAGAPIGHFGFFRRQHREILWPAVGDWLVRH